MPRVVHVLWSPQSGPICAYEDPTLAWDHAKAMIGTKVSEVELRHALPEIAQEKAYAITPISIDDIDDAQRRK
jgi:hypothetical protein